MGTNHEGKFNVAVGAVIENTNSGKILLIKRTTKADFAPGIWEDITGRMKQSEEPEVALKREIKEETGIVDIRIVKPLTINHFYRGEKIPENELILIIYWCQTPSDRVELSSEHEQFRWLTPGEALEIVDHPGVKNDILTLIKELKLVSK